MGNRIVRRGLLGGAAVALAAFGGVTAWGVGRGLIQCLDQSDERGVGLNRDARLAAVGESYLRANPDEAHLKSLLPALCLAAPGLEAALEHGTPEEIHGRVEAACRVESERDDTILCDGWLLARSEARFCAAVALATAGDPD
ncbi:MAG: hypothetical protein AAFP17_10850 [Pseudomonadota bacterium]